MHNYWLIIPYLPIRKYYRCESLIGTALELPRGQQRFSELTWIDLYILMFFKSCWSPHYESAGIYKTATRAINCQSELFDELNPTGQDTDKRKWRNLRTGSKILPIHGRGRVWWVHFFFLDFILLLSHYNSILLYFHFLSGYEFELFSVLKPMESWFHI